MRMETETGQVCPNCKADERQCLHQRLKSYRDRAPIYKCHQCKGLFTPLLSELFSDNPAIDKRATR